MVTLRKPFIFVLYFLFLPVLMLDAQRGYKLEYGLMTGISNYLGEIGGREKPARPFVLDLKLAKTRWNQAAYMRYKFHPSLAFGLALNYLRIEGHDNLSTNPGRRYRNLSFRNDIFDFETTINWLFYDSKKPIGYYQRTDVYFTSYLFVGAGVYYHNPKTYYQGAWIALQPYRTENVGYSRFGYCVPLGFGFYVTLNKRRRTQRIGLQVNWRYTNTDYLDDISTVYKNPAELPSSTSVALSNRNPELTKQPEGFSGNYGWQGLEADGVTPVNKAPRGNPNNKDSFISLNITYAYVIKSRYHKSRGKRIRTLSF
jgi:hypothetical protein